jgi:DNA-binding FadR family transcriptional regulator
MPEILDERTRNTLEIISAASEPVGSWYIVNELEKRGIGVSSATVGRLLNQLEQRGFLTKHSIRGRTITDIGRKALNDTYLAERLERHKKNLDELISSKVLGNFLMVLEARQAIEKTTARLAAERITPEQIASLRAIIEKQEQDHKKNVSIAGDDIAFHRTIAEASGNEALASLYMILATMGQQSQLFEHLRKQVHTTLMSGHTEIYEELKDHDPAGAERAMDAHLEQLRLDVNTYWDRFGKI